MLYDLLYLDEPWLRSLASQKAGDLQRRTVQTTAQAVDGKQAHDAERLANWGQRAEGSQETTEIGVLDDRFSTFLTSVEPFIVAISPSNVRSVAERALQSGTLVSATGAFFFDDFGAIKKLLDDAATYIDLQTRVNIVPLLNKAASLEKMKEDDARDHRAVDEEVKKLRLEATEKATAISTQVEQFKLMSQMVESFFKSSVECGVISGVPSNGSGALVRAFLDTSHLRASANFMLDRYGARTHAQFTIVGTVCRLGWSDELYLSQEESWAAKAVGGERIPTATVDAPRTAFRQAQMVGLKVRRMLMAGSDTSSVFLAPLAVFRRVPLEPTA
ncbi:DUF6414 family protein [Sorangium sp. So ce117]|uniref:DUF6414 family protein n=1 Tax=Sorangium sp. So ce117 TaxID=3133277 RepID=UPI003F6104AB